MIGSPMMPIYAPKSIWGNAGANLTNQLVQQLRPRKRRGAIPSVVAGGGLVEAAAVKPNVDQRFEIGKMPHVIASIRNARTLAKYPDVINVWALAAMAPVTSAPLAPDAAATAAQH